MYDIVALGETLIDFTPSGYNDMGIELFSCNPGGAPANVLAMCAKLGGRTAFVGMVGNDKFGLFLERTMREAGIDVSGLVKSADVPTTLAFVHLDESGDRSFSFYRNPGADICLRYEDIPKHLLQETHIFHFGSVSMTDEPSHSATLQSVDYAQKNGAIISFDPNYRPALWRDYNQAIRAMQEGVARANIIKVSDEELTLLTGETDVASGAQKLFGPQTALILVTGGDKGSYYLNKVSNGAVPAYKVKAVDTTGAGDAFVGAVLHNLRGMSLEEISTLSKERMKCILAYANAAGGMTTLGKGAIPSMPAHEQINLFTKSAVSSNGVIIGSGYA